MLIQLLKADPCTLKITDESGGIRICAVEPVWQQQTVVLTFRRDGLGHFDRNICCTDLAVDFCCNNGCDDADEMPFAPRESS